MRGRDDDEPDWLRSAAAQLGGAPEKENDPAQAPPPPAAADGEPGKVRELEQETRRQEKIVGKLMRELKDEKLTGAVRAVDGLERLRAELGGELRAATAGVGELRAALGTQLEAARRQLGARGADGGLAHRLADEQRARARAGEFSPSLSSDMLMSISSSKIRKIFIAFMIRISLRIRAKRIILTVLRI